MWFAFIIAESVVFGLLIWRQLIHLQGAKHALEEIEGILKRSQFKLQQVTVTDTLLNQFDRVIEFPLDNIRSFSNAALVTGIGGTMALFILEAFPIALSVVFPVDSGGIQLPPWGSIFFGLILALLSSLIGVIFHLHIASKVLSTAYQEVSNQEVKFLDAQALSQEKALEPELSKQLEELTEAWSKADAVDLVEMIPQFLKGQTKVMQKMQDRFEEEQNTTLEALQSQKEFIQRIDGFLTGLSEGQRSQQETARIFQESQLNQIERMSAFLERLMDERESLTKEIEHLPENIKNSLDVETINEIFGKQAQRYVQGMGDRFLAILEALRSDIDNYQRRLSTKLANENDGMTSFFNDLQGQIVNNVVVPLRKVADQLHETTDSIPKFGEDLFESAEALAGIPEKLEEAGKSINGVLSSTATEVLAPVSEEMRRYIYTVNETHNRLEKIIQGLVKLIRDMVREIEGSRS
ncbi:MAG: hypothetical protein OXI05_10530 [Bacteroidota bacterium]|nr:hypothetical protein [Bacteroidota bacterium]MDE2646253.1 hypothetical protein [Bacteroidota bacterium]